MPKKRWTPAEIQELFHRLAQATKGLTLPMSESIADEYGKDPYLILISCLLSLRARDTVTYKVSQELFKHAKTPKEMLKIPVSDLAKIIHSIGTYNRKAQTLHAVSAYLLQHYDGQVPRDEAALLAMPGVGRKTANLVRGIAFDIPAICVDVHVHRIANALGLVHTKTPEQTETALKKIVPQKDWLKINKYFVMWGQNRLKLKKLGLDYEHYNK